MRIDLTELENLQATEALPVERLIQPGDSATLTRLRRTSADQPAPFESQLSIGVLSCQPTHDDAARYATPFGGSQERALLQGVGGEKTHQGDRHFAFDFDTPLGTPVVAARPGIVLEVVDGFPEGGFDPALVDRSNRVLVAHSDGSIAQYSHLQKGISAREGQRVVVGDVLGKSGNSGYSYAPHLHFSVLVLGESGRYVSVPIRFASDEGGYVPVAGQKLAPTPVNAPSSSGG